MGEKESTGIPQEIQSLLSSCAIEERPEWSSLLYFIQYIAPLMTFFDKEQRAELHHLVMKSLTNKEFSEKRFAKIVYDMETYIKRCVSQQMTRLESQLSNEREFAKKLVMEIKTIIGQLKESLSKRETDLNEAGQRTITTVEQLDDKVAIIDSIRNMVEELVLEAKQEAKAWESKARSFKQIATFDPLLTNLYNRRSFDGFLPKAVARSNKEGGKLCLLMIDVDYFKKINDAYGHQVGDDVLRVLARIVQTRAQESNGFPARYGGEELVVVFEHMDMETAFLKAEAIREEVRNYDFQPRKQGKILGSAYHFTVSIGVAELKAGWSEKQLIKAADTALYQAKENGRDFVVGFTKS